MKKIIGILILLSGTSAFAQESSCVDLSKVKEAVEHSNGRLIDLTIEQWQFMRGIYAMNPETPPGLPVGDRAILAQKNGSDDGIILFIDKDQACSPMPVPKVLLDMMKNVATGDLNHEGKGL